MCTDTGTGPAVVLLHAGGERRGVWSPVAARLASAGYRSVAVDQRGHGDTGGEGDRLSEFVDDACAVLDELGSQVVLVGASLGGFVALLASKRGAAERVAGVVLVDVMPELDPERARAYLRSLESDRRSWNWALIEDIFTQAGALRDAVVRSTSPLALVSGEHGGVSEADRARLRALAPRLVERQVAGAGHLVARDRPDELADVLLDLLNFVPSLAWRTGS